MSTKRLHLVALLGKAGAGKNTAADYLSKLFNTKQIALADPLKRICKEVFDFSDQQLYGPSEYRNAPDKRYPRDVRCPKCTNYGFFSDGTQCPTCLGKGTVTEHLSPRWALQTLGSEWGRSCYKDIWIDYGIRSAAHAWDVERRPVIITDARFKNEAQKIHDAGGEVWKIIRPGAGAQGGVANHPSEVEQDSIAPDLTIDNSGSLDDLEKLLFKLGSERLA